MSTNQCTRFAGIIIIIIMENKIISYALLPESRSSCLLSCLKTGKKNRLLITISQKMIVEFNVAIVESIWGLLKCRFVFVLLEIWAHLDNQQTLYRRIVWDRPQY